MEHYSKKGNILIFLIICLFFICCNVNYDNLVHLRYFDIEDESISVYGRYVHEADGLCFTWPSSFISFSVENTSRIVICFDSHLTEKSVCYSAVFVDDNENPIKTIIPKAAHNQELVLVDDLDLKKHNIRIQVDDLFEESMLSRNDVYFSIKRIGIDNLALCIGGYLLYGIIKNKSLF